MGRFALMLAVVIITTDARSLLGGSKPKPVAPPADTKVETKSADHIKPKRVAQQQPVKALPASVAVADPAVEPVAAAVEPTPTIEPVAAAVEPAPTPTVDTV